MRLSVAAVLLALPVWTASLVALWRMRRWLPFYSLGCFGAVVFTVVIARITTLNQALEALEARQVAVLAGWVGHPVIVLGSNGLAIKTSTGWGIFDIGIECSGLIEMATVAGLVAFYPSVFRSAQRTWLIILAAVVSYVTNLGRILLIVVIVSGLGTDWVFFAHAVFGRLVFFVATIALYWWIITVPTLRHVGNKLAGTDE